MPVAKPPTQGMEAPDTNKDNYPWTPIVAKQDQKAALAPILFKQETYFPLSHPTWTMTHP
jgi:hypothetical protein